MTKKYSSMRFFTAASVLLVIGLFAWQQSWKRGEATPTVMPTTTPAVTETVASVRPREIIDDQDTLPQVPSSYPEVHGAQLALLIDQIHNVGGRLPVTPTSEQEKAGVKLAFSYNNGEVALTQSHLHPVYDMGHLVALAEDKVADFKVGRGDLIVVGYRSYHSSVSGEEHEEGI